MEYKKMGDTVVVRVSRGEELVSSLMNVCVKEKIYCAEITGLGAADHVVVGLYRVAEKKYLSNTFDGEMEITSLIGNVSEKDGKPYLHFHATFAMPDGKVIGGHLNEARISGTGEIFIRMVNGRLGRLNDPVTGLNLFDFKGEPDSSCP